MHTRTIPRSTRTMPVLLLLLALLAPPPALAGWGDTLKKAGEDYLSGSKTTTSGATSSGASSLSVEETVQGLKAALDKAVDATVSRLGQTGGFLDNPEVRIPVPESLSRVETALRAVGKGELADEFVASMNHAAEAAVPGTKDIFVKAIKDMSFDDAKSILQGGETAATEYFERATRTDLAALVRPIVSESTDEVGVTRRYKAMMSSAKMAGVGSENLDLDTYVTGSTLDGLFKIMGDEERKIRENPAARTTEILKKVFGSL